MATADPHGAVPAAPVTARQPEQVQGEAEPTARPRPPQPADQVVAALPGQPAHPGGGPGALYPPNPDGSVPSHGDAGGTRDRADGSEAVLLAVHTTDPITQLAVASYVQQQLPYLTLTDTGTPADIVVVALENPDTAAIDTLRRQLPGEPQLLMIVQGTWTADLHAALDAGVRAVLFRGDFTWDRFGEVLLQVRAGHGCLPTELQGLLMDQVRQTHHEVPAPRGLPPGGLTPREADVLRLAAEGYKLQDIGLKLSYSERTIKNVLYSVIKRHGLRNRTHAVANAIRSGWI